MHPVLISGFNVTIYTYGLFVALGVFAAFMLALRLAPYRNISAEFVNSLFIGMIICGIIGARALYAAISFEQFSGEFYRVFMFWEGGLVFFGGFAGGAIWVIYSCLRWNVDILCIADVIAPALSLGHAIGRIGCFFAGCCYGKPTDGWSGICFNHPQALAYPRGVPLHPTQLYSSLFLLLLSWMLVRMIKNPGSRVSSVFAAYLSGYGAFRILIETLRSDFRGPVIAGITSTQYIAAAALVTGLYLMLKNRARR